jgi:hypothetical protein
LRVAGLSRARSTFLEPVHILFNMHKSRDEGSRR